MHRILAAALIIAMAVPAFAQAQVPLPADDDTLPAPGHPPIADLQAVAVESDSVDFSWTQPETNAELADHFVAYELRYSTTGIITAINWAGATPLPMVPEPGNAGDPETCSADDLNPGNVDCSYWFAVRARDADFNWTAMGNCVRVDLAADHVAPGDLYYMASLRIRADAVRLTFRATADDGDSAGGPAAGYDVRYSTVPLTAMNFNVGTPMFLAGSTFPAPGTSAVFTADNAPPQTLYFAARAYDERYQVSAVATTTLEGLGMDLVTTPPPGKPAAGNCGLAGGASAWMLALLACIVPVARR